MRLQRVRVVATKAYRSRDPIWFLAMFSLATFAVSMSAPHAAASATNIYLAQSAAGAANGNDCADAKAYTFFNSSGNWGSGSTQIGPGTTVWLCSGTYGSGATNANLLNFQGSGTNGNPITLAFMSGAQIEPNYCSTSTGCIEASGVSNITIDGQNVGIVQSMTNGTSGAACPGGPCKTQVSPWGIYFTNCSNCTVQNLQIANMYLRNAQSDENSNGSTGIMVINGVSPGFQAIHNTIHDVEDGISYAYSGGSNTVTIANNTSYNCSSNVQIMDGGNSGDTITLYGYGNYFYNWSNWSDQTANYNYHHDGFHIWAVHTGAHPTAYIYNNRFGGDFGAGTAQLYFEVDGVNNVGVLWAFNNIFSITGDTGCSNCGGASFWPQTSGGSGNTITFQLLNNTFAGSNLLTSLWLEGGGGTITGTIENNIVQNFGTLFVTTTGGMLPSLTEDYNDWYCPSATCGSSGNGTWDDNNSGFTTLANWQSHSSLDAHSVLANPALNSSYVPQSGSAAIGRGTNLFGICNGQPNPGLGALCSDASGIARPSTGPWTAGGVASSSVATQPASPTGLAASVN